MDSLERSARHIADEVREQTVVSRDTGTITSTSVAEITGLISQVTRVEEVITLIQSIASQTNLLVLNATIEAERAGEHGRGFSVVALEVKKLANETQEAIASINVTAQDIVSKMWRAGASMERITTSIEKVSGGADSIAQAIADQHHATRTIEENAERAAANADDLAHNVEAVSRAAEETGSIAQNVMDVSRSVSEETEQLRRLGEEFLSHLRAA